MRIEIVFEDLPNPEEGFTMSMTPMPEDIQKDPILKEQSLKSGAYIMTEHFIEYLTRQAQSGNYEEKKEDG